MNKILSWSQGLFNNEEENNVPLPISFLIPVWDRNWAPYNEVFKDKIYINQFIFGDMNEEDAIACLKISLQMCNNTFSSIQLKKMVQNLGNDPILIGMFSKLYCADSSQNIFDLSQMAMNQFINMSIKSIIKNNKYTIDDYEQSLQDIILIFIQNGDLYPNWNKVKTYLNSEQLEIISNLVNKNIIFTIKNRGNNKMLLFRHDRILEHFILSAIIKMFNNKEKWLEYLSDPYYISIIGQALAQINPTKELIVWIRKNNPLSLIASLQYLKTFLKDNIIIINAKKWIEEIYDPKHPAAYLNYAVYFLERTYSNSVITITNNMSNSIIFARARLLNGDPIGEIIALNTWRHFLPSVNDRQFDLIFEYALKNHKATLIIGCKKLLGKINDNYNILQGLLSFVGFIASTELEDDIFKAWKSSNNKSEMLVHFLWAAIRCCNNNPKKVISPIIAYSGETCHPFLLKVYHPSPNLLSVNS